MKDVTKEFFKQPKDFGKRANLNITRVDIYASKMKNIYRLLGREKLQVKILFGKTVTRQFPAKVDVAVKTVREYGTIYFLDITYANTKDAVTIKLKDLVPGGLEKARRDREEKSEKNIRKTS